MSDTIKIDQIVARAMMQFNLSDANNMLRFQVFCEEGARSLNCLSTFTEQTETLTIVDGKAKLPCGFYKLLGARPVDSDGCSCNGDDTLYVDTIFARSCCNSIGVSSNILSNTCDCEQLFKIIGGYIHLHYPTDAAYLQLAWLGLNTDDEGLMVIEKRYERALSNYVMWQYAMTPGSNVPRDDKNTFCETWIAQKNMLIGDDHVRQWHLEKQWIGEALLNRIKISPRF